MSCELFAVSVRIHRNLNDHTPDQSGGWVITENGKRRRVASVLAIITSTKVSASTLARIRTPRGEKTASGAQGIGRRTVGAWLIGELLASDINATPTGATIHFNPFIDDTFTAKVGDDCRPFEAVGQIVRFNQDGSVEVLG